jgi:Transposase DDE domain
MWSFTWVPTNVYNTLYKFKPLFRCVQARHFSVFCWLLIALILDNGKGTLKELCGYLPPKLRYWTLMRMVRSGQWDDKVLVDEMSRDVLGWLPAPADGVIHLNADKTRKDKRGRKHPLGLVTRDSKHAPYHFGFEMVLLIASWDRYRVPINLAVMDPKVKGHQNILFRHMLEMVHLPSWVRQVIVSGDAGFAANPTLKLIEKKGWTYVFAMARNRKFTNGKYVSDLMRYLPKSAYRRRAIHKPDGRRCDYWVFEKRATLHNLGDVTMVLSKKRRNAGPNQVRLFVTNLKDVKARTVLSLYAWRWGVEVTIKELKGGLHLGRMQVTRDADRVARSVALSVCAYLLLIRLYGREEASGQPWSLFRLKQRFHADLMREEIDRTERKWKRKLKQYADAA